MSKGACFAILLFLLLSCQTKVKNEISVKDDLTENVETQKGEDSVSAVKHIEQKDLPSGLSFEGKFKDAIKWKDTQGEHIALITETGIYVSPKFKHESDGGDAELFGYHYLLNDKSEQFTLTWKVYDFISDCPVDIFAEFIDNTFKVTDLDKNGIAEVWIMYMKGCHGDVSPEEMKIIMYQGDKKYAMRGENKVYLNKDETYGGGFEFDDNFRSAPKEFREFALSMWNEAIDEKL
ncbi:hypothetical protein CLV62_12217 [Dysgonomonas alginatilytica]|uniref:Lipoprotein n=1 Tax=Dysgonomonas alginatilytica TaxID=1605892 RepID=A0A2V3PNC8_9BACT|nr:hypothetical protein [Dysgonomonas alginatilytica]PXV62064.1 hypothetical protein CLV62_12217 [Dysgonomonas alginatilytica]